jgi:hypothetical protein
VAERGYIIHWFNSFDPSKAIHWNKETDSVCEKRLDPLTKTVAYNHYNKGSDDPTTTWLLKLSAKITVVRELLLKPAPFTPRLCLF